MRSLLVYLIFNGTCRDAMKYYAKILGGEIIKMQTYNESPISFEEDYNELIFDSEVKAGSVRIKASDSNPDQPIEAGRNVSMFLICEDKNDQRMVYEALAKEGKVQFELSDQTGFAMLTDKFGISWMLVVG